MSGKYTFTNGTPKEFAMAAPAVEVLGMTKRFGSMTALDNVTIHFQPGKVHALLGENGAGKSTLVKCLVGFYSATDGQIMYDGREVEIKSPFDAAALGIGMVYQQFTLVPSMTVEENLVLSRGNLPMKINWTEETKALRATVKSGRGRVTD